MVFISVKVARTPAGDEWRHALKYPDGELTERTKSDNVERDFWHARRQNGATALDAYRLPVCNMLKKLMDQHEINSVMELGPGWGNYTFFLAGQSLRLTCVDISPDNLDYLSDALKQRMGVATSMICAPWESVEIEPLGHDMAFATVFIGCTTSSNAWQS